jgi:FolB domain-containing protein
MPDRILIQDLRASTVIGVDDDERCDAQEVLVNVALEVDTRQAADSDSIADTVNYATVAKEIIALAGASHFHLLERLAGEIARMCLAQPGVLAAVVRVEKPGAVRQVRSVGVEIRRAREEA